MSATNEIQPHTPSSIGGSFPVYFAGGLGYDAQRNKGVVDHISDLGYDIAPVLADPDIAHIDTGFKMVVNGVGQELSRRAAYNIAYKPEVEVSVSNFEQERADELLEMLKREGKPKVDAILQSADALNGLLAAAQQPNRFHNIVLAYPAGIARQPNIRRAAPRVVPSEALVRLKPRHVIAKRTQNFEGPRIRSKNLATFTIASAVGLSHQSRLLHEMRQKKNAPGVAIVAGTDDIMISPKKLFESLVSSEDVDIMLVADTTHGINGRRDVLRGVLDLFPQIEAIKQAREAGDPRVKSLASRTLFLGGITESQQVKILDHASKVDKR